MTELTAFQQAIADVVELRSDLDAAYREYEALPPLPEGYDVRETFVHFRIAPLREKIKAYEALAPTPPPNQPEARYKAPKLKTLEDIIQMCDRNRLAGEALKPVPGAAEGAGAR